MKLRPIATLICGITLLSGAAPALAAASPIDYASQPVVAAPAAPAAPAPSDDQNGDGAKDTGPSPRKIILMVILGLVIVGIPVIVTMHNGGLKSLSPDFATKPAEETPADNSEDAPEPTTPPPAVPQDSASPADAASEPGGNASKDIPEIVDPTDPKP